MPGFSLRPSGLLQLLRSDRASFVAISIAINALLLLRHFVAMRTVDLVGLGSLLLLQTVVTTIGMMHFGIIGGAYRLTCDADERARVEINNLVYSFISLLAGSIVVVAGISYYTPGEPMRLVLALLGTVGGIAMLARTWMINQMLVLGRLKELNRVNFWSTTASLSALTLAPIAPLPASVAALVLQPLFFAAAVYVMEPTLRPTGFTFDKPLTWRILSTGFTLYLTGMFLQANVQLERWYVARALGFTALGHFYLAGVWLIIFQMVPTSVEALFLARLVQARALGDEVAVSRVMRTYFLTLAGYCLLVGAATLVLAEPVVRLVLPAHAGDVIYVKLLLPGILIFTMSSPFAIVFNVIIRYQTYIAAYGAGAMITTGTYVFAVLLDHTFDLKAVILVRCFVFIVMAVIIFAGFWVVTRSNREFRFSLQEPIA